jgi:hypothetical protein
VTATRRSVNARRLLLIWLTQQDPTGSVDGWPGRCFPRLCVSFKATSPPRSLPTVPRGLPLARWFRMPPMRTSSSLRIGEPATAAVCRLPLPSLADRRDGSSQDQDLTDALVLGRLSDDHRQARCVCLARTATTGSVVLRDCLDDASQAPPSHGECSSGTAARRGRS